MGVITSSTGSTRSISSTTSSMSTTSATSTTTVREEMLETDLASGSKAQFLGYLSVDSFGTVCS